MKKILISVLVVILASLFARAVITAPLIEEPTSNLVADINKGLPKMLDSDTRFDSVAAEEGLWAYRYVMVNHNASEYSADAFRAQARKILKPNSCSNDFVLAHLKDGTTVVYAYYGKDLKYITQVDFKQGDCP